MEKKEKLTGFAKADYVVKKASFIFSLISAACIIFMAFLSVTDVVMSKFFNSAIAWQKDLITYMILPVFATLLWNIQVDGGLMSVDIFTRKFKPIGLYIVNTIFYVLGVAVYGFVGYKTFLYFLECLAKKKYSSTGTIGVQIWPYELLLGLGLLLLAFGFLWTLIRMYATKEPYRIVEERERREAENKIKDEERKKANAERMLAEAAKKREGGQV